MRRGPSCYMGKRHVKPGERKMVFGDIKNIHGATISYCLRTGVFHENEFTKEIERSLLKTLLGTPEKNKCGY